jgi:hypothetical protein
MGMGIIGSALLMAISVVVLRCMQRRAAAHEADIGERLEERSSAHSPKDPTEVEMSIKAARMIHQMSERPGRDRSSAMIAIAALRRARQVEQRSLAAKVSTSTQKAVPPPAAMASDEATAEGRAATEGMPRFGPTSKMVSPKVSSALAPEGSVAVSCVHLLDECKRLVRSGATGSGAARDAAHMETLSLKLDRLQGSLAKGGLAASEALSQLQSLVDEGTFELASQVVANVQEGKLEYGWIEVIDPSTREPYYYQVHSRTVTWVKPALDGSGSGSGTVSATTANLAPSTASPVELEGQGANELIDAISTRLSRARNSIMNFTAPSLSEVVDDEEAVENNGQ